MIAHRGPVGLARHHRNLTPALGCQDRTPWPSASAPVVLHASFRSRDWLALRPRSHPTLPRPSHPTPTFVTIREAPLWS